MVSALRWRSSRGPMPDHRIAHIRSPTVASTEIATLRLAQCLPRDDFEHVAFPADHPSAISQLFSAHGFEVVRYVPSEQSLRWPVPFLLATGRLARSLRQARVDLVHCSDVMAGFDATLTAQLLRLRVVCHVRHPHNRIPRRDWPALRLVFVVSTF
jgi:hypothetical protein